MKSRSGARAGSKAYFAVALCCVFLIVLTGFIAAVHVHAESSGASSHSCSVCALAHAGVNPTQVASLLPILVGSAALPTASQATHSLLFVSPQFIRPPPLG